MMEKVRLAPVGLGRWASVLARAARRGDVIDLVSCYSRDEQRRRAFREAFGVPREATSYEELLADPEVEGIVLTTPNDTHMPLMLQAFEAGKAVYVDKPIAHSMADAIRIAQASTELGIVCAVGHSARRLAGHREMRRWLDEGRLGRVSIAEANFSNERGLQLSPQTWRYYASKSPGGALIQLGVHHADTLQYLLGPVGAVNANLRRLYTRAEVPDAAVVILEFEAGMLGYVGCSWASPGVYAMRLFGTEATLTYELDFRRWEDSHLLDGYSALRWQGHGDGERAVDLPRTDMFREELEEFALAIRGRAAIEVGPWEGVRALAVVHAALLSSERSGARVPLEELIPSAGIAPGPAAGLP